MATSEANAADMAAAAIRNAHASMSRIDNLLTEENIPTGPITDSSVPPAGLTGEEEVEWWNRKIAALSSDADDKSGIVAAGYPRPFSEDKKSLPNKGTKSEYKEQVRMAPQGMTTGEEADWVTERMSRLSESKQTNSAKESK